MGFSFKSAGSVRSVFLLTGLRKTWAQLALGGGARSSLLRPWVDRLGEPAGGTWERAQ